MRREVTEDILMDCSLVQSFTQLYVASTHSNEWLHIIQLLAMWPFCTGGLPNLIS